MKRELLIALCVIGYGPAAKSEEPEVHLRPPMFGYPLIWDKEDALCMRNWFQKELDDIVPRIKRDTVIARGADATAGEAARERLKNDKQRARVLNEILVDVMSRFPNLPQPRYYREWRSVQRSLSPEELMKSTAGI